MSFGGGGSPPRPIIPPRLGQVDIGGVIARERRKKAHGRSSTLLSRGLLTQANISGPAGGLFGDNTLLGGI